MPAHLVEIVLFSAPDDYHANQRSLSGTVNSTDARSYHGVQIEDPSRGYAISGAVFESIMLQETRPDLSDLIWEQVYGAHGSQTLTSRSELDSSLGDKIEVDHIQFPVDPTAALTAPVCEVVYFTLREGRTKDEIAPFLDTLANQDTKTVTLSTWGFNPERENRLIMLVGWESLEAHQEVVKNPTEETKTLFSHLNKLSEFTVGHINLIAS